MAGNKTDSLSYFYLVINVLEILYFEKLLQLQIVQKYLVSVMHSNSKANDTF